MTLTAAAENHWGLGLLIVGGALILAGVVLVAARRG
jgi:hypothetical protein